MVFKFKKSNLNFRVYTSKTEPTEAGQENDIVIITSVTMPNWILSTDEPSGAPRADGDVWIRYSVKGNTFNILKNDSMMVATISAYQYVNGVWVDKTAKSYQGGKWVDWWNGELYTPGNEHESITGGFTTKGFPLNTDSSPQADSLTITRNADSIQFAHPYNACGLGYFANKIDLTYFKTLTFAGEMKPNSSNPDVVGLGIWADISTAVNVNRVAYISGNSTGGTIDVSALSGEYYIGFWAFGNGTYAKATSLILS